MGRVFNHEATKFTKRFELAAFVFFVLRGLQGDRPSYQY
jgi:hypothetical protein